MDRIEIFTYKLKSIEDIFSEISNDTCFLTNQEVISLANDNDRLKNKLLQYSFVDISLMLLGDYERVDSWIGPMIFFAQCMLNNNTVADMPMVICDKRYASNVYLNLPYFFSGTNSLEDYLELADHNVTNVVDMNLNEFNNLKKMFNNRIFGNQKFKTRLFEELFRFRNFNYIGERKIFSVFLCGPSGIGKTESAWVLHDALAHGERFIKINLGNYSEQNALSSLIGSPRGYIGSSKGELSEKVESSKSTVILIDEFEKASKEIHNFFLELLSYGSFTDSLGREFDLDKYIVVFTSNLSRTGISEKISPELWSRFDLKYELCLLTESEKKEYIKYKSDYYIDKVRSTFNLDEKELIDLNLDTIDVSMYSNMRLLNKEIETRVSDCMDAMKIRKS